MRTRFVNILFILLVLLSSIAIPTYASGILLQNTSDTLDDGTPTISNIEHLITTTLPFDGTQEINPSDYLIIKMPNFTSIDISNISITGTFVYGDNTDLHASLVGTNVVLTNLSILPGSTINVQGIKATNPAFVSEYNESIIFSTDQAGTNVIYQADILAGQASAAISATATVTAQTAQVSISGYASPNFFITITENTAVLGTTSADGTGYFQMLLTGLPQGVHNFVIYGMDSNNNTTSPTPISIYTPAFVTTNITNVLLSPVVYVSPSQVQQTDTLAITGEGVPNSNIVISINSPLIELTATADSQGNFTDDFSPSALDPGQYQVSAITETQSSQISLSSPAVNFTVLSGSSQGQTPSCDISEGDLNCDQLVSIPDFSILLYYWGSQSALADINGDNAVNLQDFSIMMFYWGSHEPSGY